MKSKIQLTSLKVHSFVTELGGAHINTIKGGTFESGGGQCGTLSGCGGGGDTGQVSEGCTALTCNQVICYPKPSFDYRCAPTYTANEDCAGGDTAAVTVNNCSQFC